MLHRQASAGSLPPDQQHHHHHHHHHHMHQGQQGQVGHNIQYGQGGYDADGGYKSDGEAYTAANHMCYKSNDSSAAAVAGQHVPHGQGRVRHHTGGHACHNHGQRPIRSLS